MDTRIAYLSAKIPDTVQRFLRHHRGLHPEAVADVEPEFCGEAEGLDILSLIHI